MNAATKPPKRARPLRRESNAHLWFVTCRIIEGRFWLHPILTSAIEPPNHKARRLEAARTFFLQSPRAAGPRRLKAA